jgi:hypothetical protein
MISRTACENKRRDKRKGNRTVNTRGKREVKRKREDSCSLFSLYGIINRKF